ncbi:MAG: hypothetical protein NVS1B7_0730 [Candidatus Saccharimonadales bacterium]
MQSITSEAGVVIGFGGTHARVGTSIDSDIENFSAVNTPSRPADFFEWMGRQVLSAADQGNSWLVAGFPGPVSNDGQIVGPLVNVPGLSENQYNLTHELIAVEPAVGRLINNQFTLIAVNDGELAAQAAADRIGHYNYARVAALILGTGVGAGVVDRDRHFSNVCRPDRKNPVEIGHILTSADPTDTFEQQISGPALERRYGQACRDLPAQHPAWKLVGETLGQLATTLGVINGVELVVTCGGVGAGASTKYAPYLTNMIDMYKRFGNRTQQLFLPEIISIPSADSQIFELFGGAGVMRDFSSRKQE